MTMCGDGCRGCPECRSTDQSTPPETPNPAFREPVPQVASAGDPPANPPLVDVLVGALRLLIDYPYSANARRTAHDALCEYETACQTPRPSPLDPDMPAQELRLCLGEMTAQEMRTARAAIRWANATMARQSPTRGTEQENNHA